ncbi:hypothetical protein FNF29_00632 [Cafeteria roenbergensis]|uniref:SUN domain-containing protein n=1 Tax=Cafeteria roenbergensis TaxID=33653 RepID=A0A5A8CYM4_CAFRO|nr:hypothetical protein FNF29_00632 [Cafeteria roenbergensis]|eukprot:KAA0157280.1 hypothetical protein FNF29_00632 [Cafeteria roenbergensis]
MPEQRGAAVVRPIFLLAVTCLWLLALPASSLQESDLKSGEASIDHILNEPDFSLEEQAALVAAPTSSTIEPARLDTAEAIAAGLNTPAPAAAAAGGDTGPIGDGAVGGDGGRHDGSGGDDDTHDDGSDDTVDSADGDGDVDDEARRLADALAGLIQSDAQTASAQLASDAMPGIVTDIVTDAGEVVGGSLPAGLRVNLANAGAGAVVLQANSESQNKRSLLKEDKDSYFMSPCSARKFVDIQLSDEVRVTELVLSNYERFASSVRRFRLLGSTSYPTMQWLQLGEFEAEDKHGEQVFEVSAPASSLVRFLRLRWETHHRNEYYCTLTGIRVHGETAMENLQSAMFEMASRQGGDDEDDEDDEDDGAGAGDFGIAAKHPTTDGASRRGHGHGQPVAFAALDDGSYDHPAVSPTPAPEEPVRTPQSWPGDGEDDGAALTEALRASPSPVQERDPTRAHELGQEPVQEPVPLLEPLARAEAEDEQHSRDAAAAVLSTGGGSIPERDPQHAGAISQDAVPATTQSAVAHGTTCAGDAGEAGAGVADLHLPLTGPEQTDAALAGGAAAGEAVTNSTWPAGHAALGGPVQGQDSAAPPLMAGSHAAAAATGALPAESPAPAAASGDQRSSAAERRSTDGVDQTADRGTAAGVVAGPPASDQLDDAGEGNGAVDSTTAGQGDSDRPVLGAPCAPTGPEAADAVAPPDVPEPRVTAQLSGAADAVAEELSQGSVANGANASAATASRGLSQSEAVPPPPRTLAGAGQRSAVPGSPTRQLLPQYQWPHPLAACSEPGCETCLWGQDPGYAAAWAWAGGDVCGWLDAPAQPMAPDAGSDGGLDDGPAGAGEEGGCEGSLDSVGANGRGSCERLPGGAQVQDGAGEADSSVAAADDAEPSGGGQAHLLGGEGAGSVEAGLGTGRFTGAAGAVVVAVAQGGDAASHATAVGQELPPRVALRRVTAVNRSFVPSKQAVRSQDGGGTMGQVLLGHIEGVSRSRVKDARRLHGQLLQMQAQVNEAIGGVERALAGNWSIPIHTSSPVIADLRRRIKQVAQNLTKTVSVLAAQAASASALSAREAVSGSAVDQLSQEIVNSQILAAGVISLLLVFSAACHARHAARIRDLQEQVDALVADRRKE